MTTRDFVEAFKAGVAKRQERAPYTPTGVVAMWEQIVDMIAGGYEEDIYEFDNDLAVRTLIAGLLEDPSIRAHEEFKWFAAAIEKLDNRLRSVMTDHPVRNADGPWWQSHLPTVAGAELAGNLETLYDFKVPRIV